MVTMRPFASVQKWMWPNGHKLATCMQHHYPCCFPGSGGVPTLREFIRFPMGSGKVNLAQEIGTSYEDFGILLLEDDNGDRTDAIVREFGKKAEDVNKRIFRLWVKGEGLQPVSWATLVDVLQDMRLDTLARGIEHVKCPKLQSIF